MKSGRSAEKRLHLAMEHHKANRLREAADLYAGLIAEDDRQPAIRHNLGMVLLGLGEFGRAVELLRRVWMEDGDNPVWRQSLPLIGMRLYENGYWEDAAFWLKHAISKTHDRSVLGAFERILPRAYLEPEIYDPQLGRTLKRYSPRESPTWVYAIDVVGTCNLRCPSCPVGNSTETERPKGFMDLDLFQRIVDKIRQECVTEHPAVFLFSWGEPLLHPSIGEIIGIAKDAGLRVYLSSNLNVERGIREVAKANPEDFKISLSGFTRDTYPIGHTRGDLGLLKANMYLLRHYLDKFRATTHVWVGHHIYKFNQEHVGLVGELCKELGFAHYPLAAFYQPAERLVRLLEGERLEDPILDQLLEHPRQYVPRIRSERSGTFDCELRFNQTAINFDGTIALCCSVYEAPNMLGVNFLDHSHEALQEMKYRHPFCKKCIAHGLSYGPREIAPVSPQ